MRINTLLRRLIDVTGLLVEDVSFTLDGDLSVAVRPRKILPRCGSCGRRAPGYDRRTMRRWRHLALGKVTVWLTYEPRRVACTRCGIRTEDVPWAPHASRFTWAFEENVAYLAQITDKTQVTRLTGIAWRTVGQIVQRVVNRHRDPCQLDGLRFIGIDEFSYRKRHRYLTLVVDHERRRVVWACQGRSAEALADFFEELGPERVAQLRVATIDMAGGYLKALDEHVPDATIVFDRFHVQRLASDALDEVRRSLVRERKDAEEAKSIKSTRWALLKNPWALTEEETHKLSELQHRQRSLYRAYLLKETLARALDYLQPWRARRALKDWLAWASRSRLPPFVRAARTIRRHLEGIIAYIHTRLTNGLVEGLNNKLRTVARRAYGFHSAKSLIAMLFLNCGGIHLNPDLPKPTRC